MRKRFEVVICITWQVVTMSDVANCEGKKVTRLVA